MAKVSRPDVFNEDAIIDYFGDRKSAQVTISCMRLLIPVLLAGLEDEELVELMKQRSPDFDLVADNFWSYEVPRIVKWAKDILKPYKSARKKAAKAKH